MPRHNFNNILFCCFTKESSNDSVDEGLSTSGVRAIFSKAAEQSYRRSEEEQKSEDIPSKQTGQEAGFGYPSSAEEFIANKTTEIGATAKPEQEPLIVPSSPERDNLETIYSEDEQETQANTGICKHMPVMICNLPRGFCFFLIGLFFFTLAILIWAILKAWMVMQDS